MTIDRPVLFYDGDCRFCRAMARAIAVMDRGRRYAYLPFSDALADDLLGPVPAAEREHSIHLAFPDGSIASAGDALAELARVLPLGGLLADGARDHRPVRGVFRWGYNLVATRRGALSGLVPDVRGPVRRPVLT
jgi:predicted DCC family thiol-disulfide oxidoreductase YuxK